MRLRNLTYRKKVTLACILASMLPVVLIGSFCYLHAYNQLFLRETTALEEALNQATSSLDSQLSSYQEALNYIVWTSNASSSLAKNYTTNYDMYLLYRDILDPIRISIHSINPEVKQISFYTTNPIYPHGTTLLPLSSLESKKWFPLVDTLYSPKLVADMNDKSLEIICTLKTHPYKSILYFQIDYIKTFQPMSQIFDHSYGICIVDENRLPIYSSNAFSGLDKDYSLSGTRFMEQLQGDKLKDSYVYYSTSFNQNRWTAYLYRPVNTVVASTYQLTSIIILIIIMSILILLIVSFVISKQLVKPLEELISNMDQTSRLNLSILDLSILPETHVNSSRKDEIGKLFRHYTRMLQKLNDMIQEIYQSKILQQNYEMRALQAQINPHFLYNSLSLINNRAIIADREDISEMTLLLSTFYRTSLNHGRNILTIKDELNNMFSYIRIQEIMHDNSFQVIYDIDSAISGFFMLNLLLQPLVENAISHGINHKETRGRGELTIRAFQWDLDIIFCITDNGCGIPKSILDTILTTETKGYGIQNVHHRVELYYGEGYGLSYQSKVEEGTTVTLRIKKEISL